MKSRTWDQIEAMKAKAARFVRDVLGDADRADEIDDESVESYADRKRIEILDNPAVPETVTITQGRCITMAGKSKADLEAELAEAQDYIEELESKLDDIAGIASDEEDEEDAGEDDDEPGE